MGLLVGSERRTPIVLALLGAPAAAAGAAALRVLAGWLCLSAAIAAPLGRGWLRGRAGAAPLLRVLRTGNGCFRSCLEITVQLFTDELDDDLANELFDRLPQLLSNQFLELRRRGHDQAVYDQTRPV